MGRPLLHVVSGARRRAPGAPRAIAVASGKGGVGKTQVVANLALALRRRGCRVLVLDADVGLANIDVLFGLAPRHTLADVLSGERTLGEVVVAGPEGLQIIPAASGVVELTHLGPSERLLLLEQLERLEDTVDLLLLDTAAGISPNVLYFSTAAHQTIVVVAPEPTSLADAYALIKVLVARCAERDFQILINMARGDVEARATFVQLARVTGRFLGATLHYLGNIPYDQAVATAVRRQQAVLQAMPAARASRSFVAVADHLLDHPPPAGKGGLQFFRRVLGTAGEAG